MRRFVLAFAALVGMSAPPSFAQQDPTLADIRQELYVLYVEIQKLKRELSTTGAPSVQISGSGTVLERVSSIETALQHLTARTEQLEFQIERVVKDGTNRIGDLEFRLVELEGGDVSQLGQTTTLGGPAPAPSNPVSQPVETQQAELAIGEKADFDAAKAQLDDNQFSEAAASFARFVDTYPGSPLAPMAQLNRGAALSSVGDTRESARAFLAAFSADPTGPAAPEALVELGKSLGALGQVEQACVTLSEVSARFPASTSVADAASAREALGCR